MKSPRMLMVKERRTLFSYLKAEYPETKRTTLKQWLRHGAVFVNGNPVTRHDHMVEPKDRVVVERAAPAPKRKSTAIIPEIVFEDKHLIVIDKPEGLLTIATEKETHRTAYRQVMAYVQEDRPHRGERIFIVHRLDRDTSGLLVFARTEESKRAMQEHWERAEKKYYAVVEGVPRESEGTIRSHLRENPKSLKMHSAPPSDEAKLAITRYRALRSTRHFTLLEVKLDTGRKNQIRAHLSEHGHPIVGDKKYDAHGNPIKRLGLHAYYLAFPHPVTGKRMQFRSELPKEFERLLDDDVTTNRTRRPERASIEPRDRKRTLRPNATATRGPSKARTDELQTRERVETGKNRRTGSFGKRRIKPAAGRGGTRPPRRNS